MIDLKNTLVHPEKIYGLQLLGNQINVTAVSGHCFYAYYDTEEEARVDFEKARDMLIAYHKDPHEIN